MQDRGNLTERISLSEMQDAIQRSGYPIEQRVEQVLTAHTFIVQTNPAFVDSVTGKSREYDIKAWTWHSYTCEQWGGHITAVLLIECKNNWQPIVFFTAESVLKREIMIPRYSGIPARIQMEDGWHSFHHASGLMRNHHWHRWPFATQYCTFHRKNTSSPWIALHDEEQHGTFNSVVQALWSEIEADYRSMINIDWNYNVPNLNVYYPLIVLHGPMYGAAVREGEVYLFELDHVSFVRHLFRQNNTVPEAYSIDVISESYLPTYIAEVYQEVENAARGFEQDKEVIDASIGKLMERLQQDAPDSGASCQRLLEPE